MVEQGSCSSLELLNIVISLLSSSCPSGQSIEYVPELLWGGRVASDWDPVESGYTGRVVVGLPDVGDLRGRPGQKVKGSWDHVSRSAHTHQWVKA